MGHKSKKKKQSTPPPYPQMDMNNMGQPFNNIDISSMSNILNNMDINQIVSMLSNTFTNQTNAVPNPASEVNVKNEGNNPFNLQNSTPQNTQPNPNPLLQPNDPIVMVLNSIKPLLPPDKSKIIDDFIQLIGIKMVIDKVFPPLFQGNNIKEATAKAPENKEVLNTPPNDIKENL